MPWKETNAVDQRLMFIGELLRNEQPFSALCRAYGISRPTGYKWRARYLEGGANALLDRTAAPLRHPNATPESVVALVVAARQEHPTWGPRKLKALLERQYPGLRVPAASTIGTLLSKHGLVRKRRRVRRDRPLSEPRVPVSGPNDCWCFDFKGQFRLKDRVYCFPLTGIDAHSRYMLTCTALSDTKVQSAYDAMKRVFEKYGLPTAILTDCGVPFASTSFSGLTELSAWWIALGIRVHRSRPGNPQDNGRLERLHKTLKAEATRPPEATMGAQQRRFDRFRQEYNEVRPHESLDDTVPAESFTSARRRLPRRLPKPQYPAESVLRRVKQNGTVHYAGHGFTVTHVLRGQQIALVPVQDGMYDIRFYKHTIGRLDLRASTLSNGRTTKNLKKKGNPPATTTLLQRTTNL